MIERSFQGLSGDVETVGIVKELMEIWLNKVCDTPTQPLTKITPYTLKRISFTISKASEMKARVKEAVHINLHSKKYIIKYKCWKLN